MSLFDKLRMTTMDIEEEFSDLDLFLGLVKDIEEKIQIDEEATMEPVPLQSKEFFKILKDPRRACVTGSAVLSKQTGKTNIARDIDIFVDNRDSVFQKILKGFFNKENIKNLIWPMYQKRTNAPDKDRGEFVTNSVVVETSSAAYDFKIETYSLNTFRVRLGSHIMLNFILLEDTIQSKKTISINDQEWSPMDGASSRPYTDNCIRELATKGFINSYEEVQQYTTYVVEYIDKHFDFQELKFVYDFKTKSIIHIYQVAMNTLDTLVEKLTRIESNKFTDRMIQQLGGAKVNLQNQLDEHKEKFSNPEMVTISSGHTHRYYEIQELYNLDKEQAILGNNFVKTAEQFGALTSRIKHYQQKGFRIQDPNNVLVELHTNICAVALGSLVDPAIHTIERQSIFNSQPGVKKKYLFLNRLKSMTEDNEDKFGLDLVRPLTAEEEEKREKPQRILEL